MTADEAPTPEELQRRIQERERRLAKLNKRMHRVEAAQNIERRQNLSEGVKYGAIAVGLLLLVAGGAWAVNKLQLLTPEQCRFHEHATFRVFEGEQDLSFRHPKFDMGAGMSMRAHLHQPDDSKIHLEGGCRRVELFLESMGVKVKPGRLELDQQLHGGRVLSDSGNQTLQFFLYHDVGGTWNWTAFPGLPDHQLREKQRMLVAYGNYTTDQLSAIQARVPVIENS